ncbi:hypothetical protein QE377_002575 [Microbacterium sp. SORGH_AS 862]|nr:hypothetical protein [Microbacterium sp. SORGH_AS_0862]
MNVVREDDGREMPVIDPKDFASSVAPLLAPLLNANLGTLSDETIAEIAKAAADEQARRLAS